MCSTHFKALIYPPVAGRPDVSWNSDLSVQSYSTTWLVILHESVVLE
jgi:hypothetical protein